MQRVHVVGLDALVSRGPRGRPESLRELAVCVPYTNSDLTRAALTATVTLTRNLGARVTLIGVLVVPFPLPLQRPGVSLNFVEQELQAAARDIELELDAQIVIARDRQDAFRRAISPESLVVLATKKRWWPTQQAKLARLLVRAGHRVALLET